MLQKIPSLQNLIHELGRLPGVGPKTAQRLAYYILRTPADAVKRLGEALDAVKSRVRECPTCFAFTEGEGACSTCTDPMRLNHQICVVEDPADIERIETSGVFRGRYHVLHGAISPLDNVGPQDLKIEALLERLHHAEVEGHAVTEIILALDADLEGDTTVLYLAKILKDMKIKASRIAHGVPIGGDIDYIDHRTLGRAIENRVRV